jgi:RNA polymerase sigma-70 factor (ECF subfamily)
MIDYRAFYARYYPRAYLFVKSYVHDPAVAEDLASEAMVTVWRDLDPKREAHAPQFLFTILRNKCLNYLEREKKRWAETSAGSWQEGELDLRISALNRSTEQSVFSHEIHAIIHATLERMPERTREIFLLNRNEEKSYAEIAARFDISEKGVEYHISKALRLLRIALKDYIDA